jgi:16S rRNA (cytosine1402-N4)-methyltransferase
LNDSGLPHTTVLLEESVEALALRPGDVAIDCTVGAGGHTEAMLARVGQQGLVIGLDRDATALELARGRLAGAVAAGRLRLVQARFSAVAEVARDQGVEGRVQGVLADIGVSSMHLNQAERGFSFQAEGPLDMRMDASSGETAADLLNSAPAEELARIFWEYGEEPQSRQIARRIVEARAKAEIRTTTALAELVKRSVRYTEKSKKHPATRVFQALRIAVNDELSELEAVLTGGFSVLKPGGRLAIISFHSLEDRLVKTRFIDLTARRERSKLPRNLPLRDEQLNKLLRITGEIVKPFPLAPSDEEIARNPRARSAKLRVVAKLPLEGE